jgi:gamma-glutamyl:cysteine ligase YbdK (ATP-grasp superfamily)
VSGNGRESQPLRLFEGYGIELEYTLVGIDDLDVLPVADRVLEKLAGGIVNQVEIDSCSWSNELVLHVLELKNTLPASALAPLGEIFTEQVKRVLALVEPLGATLMPAAMHPWMRPREETRLWPHEGWEIYEAFDRVFDCRRHGWANLQSAQLNLSFGDDEEFGRLHAAVRLVLPLLAALSAASPVAEGELTGLLDTRLEVYRTNGQKIPAMTGQVIPEPVFRRSDYEKEIFAPLYEQISAHDPDGTLRHPWLNARGAIAQFGRDAIEIRVLDVQECPGADIAVAEAVTAVVAALVEERFGDYQRQRSWPVAPLAEIFLATTRDAEQTVVRNRDYLELFDYPERDGRARDLWQHLLETLSPGAAGLDSRFLSVILDQGPLARRILRALGESPKHEDLEHVYRELCRCLQSGESFSLA